ncbi:MAG: DUF2461 domain-containing protein, partial [Acidobacteriota bacterium]
TRMSQPPRIGPELFEFLRDLAENNNRDWFQANKARYENDVREPMLQLISDFASPLRQISRHFVADPRRSGGSLFRIYRDTRFAKDKTPYKTNVAAQFRHRQGKDVHAPGFYLSLEPGTVHAGTGLWHPDSKSLKTIREAIVERPRAWKSAIGGTDFRQTFEMYGDSLKRAPKGFDPEHPLIEDLRRKDFVGMKQFDEADAVRPDFSDRFADCCRKGAPLTRFLTQSLGLPG